MDLGKNISTSLKLTDEKSFDLVFRTYYRQLCAFAMNYVDSIEEAEEIVQEVFAKVWDKIGTLDIKTTPKSYLYGAVRNSCFNFLKHQKVKQAYVAHELHVKKEGFESDRLEAEEIGDAISTAVQKLPERCRMIFEKSKFEDKKYREIAEEMDISIKTVENQMGRALKFLRNELKHFMPLIALIYFF